MLLSRLVMVPGGHFALQYVEAGGLQPQMVKLMLSSQARPGVQNDSLIIFSILARASRDFYPPLHASGAYPYLLALLKDSPDEHVRARVCNLVGNMCRHSDYFYEFLLEHEILGEVISCASDPDSAVRKFACFAIGNAAFHSPSLYETLRPAVAPLVKCLSDDVEKTRRWFPPPPLSFPPLSLSLRSLHPIDSCVWRILPFSSFFCACRCGCFSCSMVIITMRPILPHA